MKSICEKEAIFVGEKMNRCPSVYMFSSKMVVKGVIYVYIYIDTTIIN